MHQLSTHNRTRISPDRQSAIQKPSQYINPLYSQYQYNMQVPIGNKAQFYSEALPQLPCISVPLANPPQNIPKNQGYSCHFAQQNRPIKSTESKSFRSISSAITRQKTTDKPALFAEKTRNSVEGGDTEHKSESEFTEYTKHMANSQCKSVMHKSQKYSKAMSITKKPEQHKMHNVSCFSFKIK